MNEPAPGQWVPLSEYPMPPNRVVLVCDGSDDVVVFGFDGAIGGRMVNSDGAWWCTIPPFDVLAPGTKVVTNRTGDRGEVVTSTIGVDGRRVYALRGEMSPMAPWYRDEFRPV